MYLNNYVSLVLWDLLNIKFFWEKSQLVILIGSSRLCQLLPGATVVRLSVKVDRLCSIADSRYCHVLALRWASLSDPVILIGVLRCATR